MGFWCSPEICENVLFSWGFLCSPEICENVRFSWGCWCSPETNENVGLSWDLGVVLKLMRMLVFRGILV